MLKFFLLAALAAVLYKSETVTGQTRRVVCYYTNWAQYRPNYGKFYPENADPNLCTHYIYAFATLRGSDLKAFEWNDDSTPWSKGMYERFQGLKTINPKLKTLLGVGGWNLGSGPFTNLVSSQANMDHFAQNAVQFLRKRGFDGLDVDWEYPANRGSPPGDRGRFTQLLQTLRRAFENEARQSGQPKLLLTAAVAAGKSNIDTAYDIPQISQTLDFINLMSYDLHGSWETKTGHNSPLHRRQSEKGDDVYLNLAWAANYWAQKGAPRDKLNIGVATYGRTFTLTNPSNHGLGAPVRGPGDAGPETREKGFLAYYEICDLKNRGGRIHEIPEQQVRYLEYNSQWVGFDDERSLADKVCFIKKGGFGGVMIWATDLDDFRGSKCGQGKYPLLNAINRELRNPSTNCAAPQGPVPTNPIQTFPPIRTNPPLVTYPIRVTNPPTPGPVATVHPGYPGVQTSKPYVGFPTPQGTTQHVHSVQGTNSFSCAGKASDFYASPSSCTEYFICANQVSYRVECATGLRFNSATKYCDWPQNVVCRQQPGQATQKPVTNAQARLRGRVLCANRPERLIRDPLDCGSYFQCTDQGAYHRQCAPGTAFSQDKQNCDFAYNVPGCEIQY